MHYRKVNAKMTAVQFNSARNQIKQIPAFLPFRIQLSPLERQTLNKMNDKRYSFVEKTVGYAEEFPELFPSYLPNNSLRTDLDNFRDLRALLWLLEPLVESLRDTMIQCGHQALTGALRTYHNIKQAATMDVPGVDAIYADLTREFVRSYFSATELAESESDSDGTDTTAPDDNVTG